MSDLNTIKSILQQVRTTKIVIGHVRGCFISEGQLDACWAALTVQDTFEGFVDSDSEENQGAELQSDVIIKRPIAEYQQLIAQVKIVRERMRSAPTADKTALNEQAHRLESQIARLKRLYGFE